MHTIEDVIIKAFCILNTSILESIDDKKLYSYNNKQELIEELKIVFDRIKPKGISCLKAKASKCKYCYPNGNTYSFHHPETDEFIIRYVIFKEKDGFYRVEECKNNPIKNTKDGLPF